MDVGGSSIKCALVDLGTGELAGARHSIATPAQDSTDALLDAIASVISNVPGDHAVGLAFPSVITRGTVRTAAHLNKAWIGQPLAALATARLQRSVIAINDADAAGLAEVHYGAAKDVPGTVLLLTLGTGIGSALFIDGRLVPNTWDAWTDELNLVINEMHALLWPDLIVLCGGITEEPELFVGKLHCEARLAIGMMRAHAGIVGAALATRVG